MNMRTLILIILFSPLLTIALLGTGCPGGPGQVDVPDQVKLQAEASGEPVSMQLRVDGSWCEYAKVRVDEKDARWLAVTPGNVKIGESITIVATPGALAAGQHEGVIDFFPDRGSGVWRTKVLLTVAPPSQPGD